LRQVGNIVIWEGNYRSDMINIGGIPNILNIFFKDFKEIRLINDMEAP
jgi:hypothetical protein